MDHLSPQKLLVSLLALTVLFYTYNLLMRKKNRAQYHHKTAPEPSGARPLIGHIHLLATQVPAYRVLGHIADKYGPIFSIKLGMRRALVVSSWEAAKECLGTNDKIFMTRPISAAAKYLGYGGAFFGLAPHRPYWRNMRRISTQELLSNTRLETLKHVRSSELGTCIKHLFSLCKKDETIATGSAKVDMGEWFSHVIMNVMMLMIAGKKYSCSDKICSSDSKRFVRAIKEFMELLGTFVLSDVIPFTEWMDLKGHIKAMKRTAKELDHIMSEWLEEHVQSRGEGKMKDKGDFIDVMLSTLEDGSTSIEYPIGNCIKATALNLIIAGVDTTSITLTWALGLVLNHKEVLVKAQNELDIHVGRERWVEESDIKNMKYLVAIVKEAMRLYPAGPLNVPREAMEDCTVGGYYVPKGTRLLVNIWKLHRDPQVWSDPCQFQPERFLTSHAHFDVRGKNFEYMPFSSGRRSCPGISSGMQMSCLALARVLQGFNLATPGDQKVDMSEGLGITLPRATPLEVKLSPRLPDKLYKA